MTDPTAILDDAQHAAGPDAAELPLGGNAAVSDVRSVKRIHSVSQEEYKKRLSWSLDRKVEETLERVARWYVHWHGRIYVSFSGGLDSTALLHMLRNDSILAGLSVPVVFFNTGNEFPEIVRFVRSTRNIVELRPRLHFQEVLNRCGYPLISKRVSQYVHEARTCNRNSRTYRLRTTGITDSGKRTPYSKIPNKWLRLIDAPFQVGSRCCHFLKRIPAREAARLFGWPVTAQRAQEGQQRELTYLMNGCNAYGLSHPVSNPMAFWTHDDVLEYIKTRNVSYSDIYNMGYRRTGCAYCGFGIHLSTPNRFQLMSMSHPKMHRIAMNKFGYKLVLDWLGIETEFYQQTLNL